MKKLLVFLKICILISLFILFLTASLVNKTHCETCKFELEGEKMSASEFIHDYFEVCIDPFVKKNNNLNLSGLIIK